MLNFVVDSNLAFDTIQKASFKEMLNAVAGKKVSIPSTTVFMNFLKTQYDEMKKKLSEKLNKHKYVCITTDVWSSRAQAYLGMTVHFINDDLVRESYVLSFRQLHKKQTNDVLMAEIVKVLADYDIKVEKVTHIVTDGGSAFCKAFKVYGRGSDHLVEEVANEPDAEGEEDVAQFMQYDDGESFFSNIIRFEENEEIDVHNNAAETNDVFTTENETENEIEEFDDLFEEEYHQPNVVSDNDFILPPHRRCLSHLLNLISNEFEKELNAFQSRSKKALYAALNKLQKLWVLPRKSSYAKTIAKEVLGRLLTLPCETRWNSKYDAIKRVLDLRPKMNEYVDQLKEKIQSATNLQNLTNDDWNVLGAYIKVMEPIAIALDTLQSDKNGDQGIIVPTLITMRYFNLTY